MKRIETLTFVLTRAEHVDAVLNYLPKSYKGKWFDVALLPDGKVEARLSHNQRDRKSNK